MDVRTTRPAERLQGYALDFLPTASVYSCHVIYGSGESHKATEQRQMNLGY
ncbi:rCG50926, isoform CRA_a [Rattus norvegicus]|uniref:RCG50926, isoform CRA_a n=1 Tax=Rattus norvegicus TaxID=10116 RepID=A6KJ34_RAT|nr:rCG50926, isoform CRA_a [Rattus norvegicus]